MKTEVYVVSIVGANVHQGYSLKGVIPSITMDHLIRSRILGLYGVFFEEKASRHFPGFWEFKNISDDRDITLRIEKTSMWVKE
jgi:hypothetical protein